MNNLHIRRLFIFTILISLSLAVCEAQSFERPPAPKQSRSASKKGPLETKKVRIRGPRSAEKAKKEQKAKDKKRRKDSQKYIKENQQRSLEIQTPEVKARMKQNVRDANSRYKNKRKKSATTTRKAGGKYK